MATPRTDAAALAAGPISRSGPGVHDGTRRIVAALTQLGSMQFAIAAAGLARNKTMAVYLRPEGFGEFTQLASIAAPVYAFAQFGMAVGLSRNTAAARDRDERQRQLATANILTTALALISLAALIPLMLTPAGGSLLASLGVHPGIAQKAVLLVLLAIAPIEVLRNNFLSVLQGVVDVKGISTRRTVAILGSTAVAVPLIGFFGIAGACAAAAVASIWLAVLLGRRCRALGFRPLEFSWHGTAAAGLAALGAASLVSAVSLSFSDTMVRAHLIAGFGIAENGQYQAAVALSSQITAVILGSVGAYSLATLTQAVDVAQLKERMNDLLRVVLPVGTLGLAGVGLVSQPLASLLFSAQFAESTKYLALLLAANYVQAMAWVVGAPLLGRRLVRTWVAIQTTGAGIRYGTAVFGSPFIGAYAIPAGFLAAMVFDLAANLLVCRWRIGLTLDWRPVAIFLAGAVTVAGAAIAGDAGLPIPALILGAAVIVAVTVSMAWRETVSAGRALKLRFAKQA